MFDIGTAGIPMSAGQETAVVNKMSEKAAFEKAMEVNMLYDFYGLLLTEKQRRVMSLYHQENYSLSEIGEELGISRQGVHDNLKTAEKALYEYEEKLSFVRTSMEAGAIGRQIKAEIEGLMGECDPDNAGIQVSLNSIKQLAEKLI